MSELRQKGVTSQSIEVLLRDATTGLGKTGLVYNTSGLLCAYSQDRKAPVSITAVTLAASTSAWASGGFKEKDATKCPGLYRFDPPDAVFADVAGVNKVRVFFTGAGIIDKAVEIDLTSYDPTTIDKTGFALGATGFDLVDDQTDAVETGLTRRGWRRLLGAAIAGVEAGRGTATTTWKNAVAGNKTRITAVKDDSNNRATVTTDTT